MDEKLESRQQMVSLAFSEFWRMGNSYNFLWRKYFFLAGKNSGQFLSMWCHILIDGAFWLLIIEKNANFLLNNKESDRRQNVTCEIFCVL